MQSFVRPGVWSPRAGACILLRLLIEAFVPSGSIVLALDKTSGLRWMSLMLLAPIPWAGRVWALPFLTTLVPSERACRAQGRRHETLRNVGRQMAVQARRWLPERDLVLVGDSTFSG